MTYEVRQKAGGLKSVASEWIAEAFDPRDRSAYTVTFSGPNARERAVEYAAWKNSQQAAK